MVEYQREGYGMFVAMLDGIKEDFLTTLFSATVSPAPTLSATPAPAADTEPPTGVRRADPGAVVGGWSGSPSRVSGSAA